MVSDAPEFEKKVPDPADIFECQRCNDCCKGYGGTFVTEKDIQAISEYIGVPPERFVDAYCRFSGKKPVIAQGKDGYCVFLTADGCGIHPVKPKMCRAWPFIESVLRAPENWRIMAGACPGMRTDFSDEAIVACVSRVLAQRDVTP
ncbi:MAG: YkgJ family cysteine cluster protein [Desulfobacterales bacterium]|jgi:Fe-S-cluster containining protein|nr:YkgJ family cysteine cluster protein [Desulfobacterales bacterium]